MDQISRFVVCSCSWDIYYTKYYGGRGGGGGVVAGEKKLKCRFREIRKWGKVKRRKLTHKGAKGSKIRPFWIKIFSARPAHHIILKGGGGMIDMHNFL